jgi:hypothetical protein
LPVYLFQASSKFQAMCVVFHLFSFESLASFKNKRRTGKSEEENWYFLKLQLLKALNLSQGMKAQSTHF